MEVKVKIKHLYRGIPYEIEMDAESISSLDALDDLLMRIHAFIDEIVEAAPKEASE
jgi:actin-like ATPase involved in cell morphogenesis